MKDYHACSLAESGNVYQWDTDKLEMENLDTVEIDQQTFCAQSPDYYISKGEGKTGKLEFAEALEFCENIGGELAVISDQNVADSINLNPDHPTWSGYTDIEKVRSWLQVFGLRHGGAGGSVLESAMFDIDC